MTTDLGHLSAPERAGARPSLMRSTERVRRARRAEGWEEGGRRTASWESGGWEEEHFRRINSVGRTMQRLRCREVREHARWQDGWGNVARSPQWRGEEAPWVEAEPGAAGWEEGRGERSTVELRSPEYRGQSEAFGDVTRSPQSPGPPLQGPQSPPPAPRSPLQAPRSPLQAPRSPQDSPESPEYSASPQSPAYDPRAEELPPSPPHQRAERWARSPSPGPSWSHQGHHAEGPSWPPHGHGEGPSWAPQGHHQGHRPRDPRKRPRRSSPLSRGEVLAGHRTAPNSSPSPPRPFATPPRHGARFTPPPPLSPPSPGGGGSTEAAAGSRPGSPQASPPRHPYSPILYVRWVGFNFPPSAG